MKMRVGFAGLLLFALWLLLIVAPIGHYQRYSANRDGKPRLSSLEQEERNEPRKLPAGVEMVQQATEPSSQYDQDGPLWTLSHPATTKASMKSNHHHHDTGNLEGENDNLDSMTFSRSHHQQVFHPSSQEQGQHQEQSHPLPSSNAALRGRKVQQITIPPRQKCHGIKMIVQCMGGIAEATCKQELIDNGVVIVSDMKDTMFFAICVNTPEEIDFVTQLASVTFIEDDHPRTLAHVQGSRGILELNKQIIPYGVDSVKARQFWNHYGSRGAGVTVCVIDSGLRTTHEDLKEAEMSGSNDEDFLRWNEANFFHGTHVTGTIVAQDNGVGVVGVAPDVSLYMVRAADDDGLIAASDLILAMHACNEAGADIINMSLSGFHVTNAERDFIRQLRNSDVLLVAASGNYGYYGYLLLFPAAYEDVISVGAVDDQQRVAPFSTYNAFVDLVAPGVNVTSLGIKSDQSYRAEEGTSMSAPHVTGVAALLWSQFPNASADEILTALTESARDLGACGRDRHYGHGMVDAMAAAAYLEDNTVKPPVLENCVEVEINVTTDIFGNETFFVVTPKGSDETLVYSDGPYDSMQLDTHTSTFLVPDGCYVFLLFDIMGDGSTRLTPGQFTVTYDGVEQINYDEFTSSEETFTFGNCD